MTRTWVAVRTVLPAGSEEALAEVVAAVGALGAMVEPRGDGAVGACVWLPDLSSAGQAATALAELGGEEPPRIEEEADRDWMRAYRESARAFPVGRRWWVDPRPDVPSAPPADRLRLAVEPRTAFGSGSHESTRLVLCELEDHPPAGRMVLDVGTGTGILALAADRLGAASAVGFDVDPEAVWVARQTAAAQEWRCRVRYFVGRLEAVAAGAGFDLVLCNMVAEELLPLVDGIAARLAESGQAVFSGILADQLDDIRVALAGSALAVVSERRDGCWAALRVVRG